MMENILNKIKAELNDTFKEVNAWFDVSNNLLEYRPKSGGWTIKGVLKHISLTNYFLLILIKKGTRKAIELSHENDFSNQLINYKMDWGKLKTIGEHKSFEWNRPAHMEPTGNEDIDMVRKRLNEQLNECFDCLSQLKNGEGVLYKTAMTVNGLGKIDVYHYIYFLVQHAKRHLEQMKKVKSEYE
jgi:hypothetical protein